MSEQIELIQAEKNWLTHYHDQPTIYGVAALIVDEQDQVLLLLRNKDPKSGHWTIPGGKLKLNETFEAAMRREVKEEIGVEVDIEQLLINTHPVQQMNGWMQHWFSPVYLVSIKAGVAKNMEPDAHQQLRWFSLNKTPDKLNQTTRVAIHAYQLRKGKL